ncbi:ABC transporter ATP-binding protein [Propionivibrio sp.]|uniref:ABC transporter ATP-binding protein n=1 Tax=Propionivibrio sp. TaxID=2212460 RepID=UPI0039E3A002
MSTGLIERNKSVSILNLGKSFRAPSRRHEQVHVLSDVNLHLEQGDFYVLLGPSGCGKSTLLNIIAGFIDKTEGDLVVNGRHTQRPGVNRGVVFQHPDSSLFPWLNVRENIEFGLRMRGVGRREREDTIDRFIGLVGLSSHEHKFPSEISGGMKQRVQIARVLSNNPSIMLMDEPFGALDAQTRRLMQRELVRIWQATGNTIIFVTHDIQEAVLLGQRIGIMSRSPHATIRTDYEIDLPYPRDETSPEFSAWYRKILFHFEDYTI